MGTIISYYQSPETVQKWLNNNSSHDEHDHKYTEPSLNSSNDILEEEDILNEELFTEIINDDDNDDLDPSISDIEHSKTPSNKHSYRDRKKSKSSTNLLSLISITKTIKNKEDKYIRQRRHSESSSESHSNDYHKNNSKKRTKLPILIPLNVNGKITKKNPNSNNNSNNNNNNKRSFKSPTPKSLTRSILSRYKQVKLQSKKKQNDDSLQENFSNNSFDLTSFDVSVLAGDSTYDEYIGHVNEEKTRDINGGYNREYQIDRV